jgi:hypothetical protein
VAAGHYWYCFITLSSYNAVLQPDNSLLIQFFGTSQVPFFPINGLNLRFLSVTTSYNRAGAQPRLPYKWFSHQTATSLVGGAFNWSSIIPNYNPDRSNYFLKARLQASLRTGEQYDSGRIEINLLPL